jgi:hypothetical protein
MVNAEKIASAGNETIKTRKFREACQPSARNAHKTTELITTARVVFRAEQFLLTAMRDDNEDSPSFHPSPFLLSTFSTMAANSPTAVKHEETAVPTLKVMRLQSPELEQVRKIGSRDSWNYLLVLCKDSHFVDF